MDHPLRNKDNKTLRGRVISILKVGFSIIRQSNIVFVCGGNKPADMRQMFEQEFPTLLPDYEFFKPEFAMKSYYSFGVTEPFDIAEFENLVGNLSIAIVLFPEAPGSFAELGYFSGQKTLIPKLVLALDSNHQRSGSFISLGPAKKISQGSIFGQPIQLNYNDPDFSLVSERISEFATLRKKRQNFQPGDFRELNSFELFALIHQLVAMLVVATNEDIESLLRGMFNSHVKPSMIKKITSILLGSKRLKEVGEYGHLAVADEKAHELKLRDGFKLQFIEVTTEISSILNASNSGFSTILEELT